MYTIYYIGKYILYLNTIKKYVIFVTKQSFLLRNYYKNISQNKKSVDKQRIMVYNGTCNEIVTEQKLKRNR